ncbi:DUF1700 domain-containing protein [Xylocopilactobacillus apis]|uniref:Membrane protein n=1 Tax=Xylocopilactobacillus apis TaxID=2932183 RepID=A0AAU9DFW2_9LACO|nr:DUF1700 domain-containing protein [Xylocopilactobacillus apis]BDR55602.1 membrane protein [Xylocopilactobacillus apis]
MIEQYIDELKSYLRVLDIGEQDEAIEFYEEYLLDANVQSREEIERELGTPKQLARKILTEYSLTDDKELTDNLFNERSKTKHDLRSIWWILIGIAAIPIGIPLVAILFACLVVIFAIMFVVVVVSLALLVGGIGAVILAIQMIFSSNWPVALFYGGSGLMLITLILMLEPLDFKIFRWLISTLANLIRKIGKKFFNRRDYHKGASK